MFAAFDGAGHSGVGHGGERQGGGGAHGLDGGKHGGGPGGAVDADRAGAPLGEQGSGLGGRRAVKAVALVVDGDHGQHGQMRSGFLRGQQSFAGLVERGHGFQNQHVYAGFGQGANLLGKGGAGFVQARLAQRFEADAERTDGASYPRFAGLLVFKVGYRLLGEAHPGCVDFRNFASQTVPCQPEAVGAEGVGFDDLSAGLQIFLMNREDQVRIGKIQLVVAAVDEHAAGIEYGAHSAIGKDGTTGENFVKLRHSLDMLCQLGGGRQRAGPLCYTSKVISNAGTVSARGDCHLPDVPADALDFVHSAAVRR